MSLKNHYYYDEEKCEFIPIEYKRKEQIIYNLSVWILTGVMLAGLGIIFLSTKIVVMSPRPGRIIDVIESPFSSSRSLEIRDSKEFISISQRVREGLRSGYDHNEKKG